MTGDIQIEVTIEPSGDAVAKLIACAKLIVDDLEGEEHTLGIDDAKKMVSQIVSACDIRVNSPELRKGVAALEKQVAAGTRAVSSEQNLRQALYYLSRANIAFNPLEEIA